MEFKIFKTWQDYCERTQNFTVVKINTMQELADIYTEYEKQEYYVSIDFESKAIFLCANC